MGYDVHITRATDWLASESAPISLDEWRAFVAADPEFRLDNTATFTTPAGDTIEYRSDGLSVWTAYSGHGKGGNMAWFAFRSGRIVVKNPDDEILRKMREVAKFFGATVVGDEGEEY